MRLPCLMDSTTMVLLLCCAPFAPRARRWLGASAQELPAAMSPGLELVLPPFSAATQSASTPRAALHCGLVKGEM